MRRVTILPNPDIVPSVSFAPNIYLDPDATASFYLALNLQNQGGISTPTTYSFRFSRTAEITPASPLVANADLSVDAMAIIVNGRTSYRLKALANGESVTQEDASADIIVRSTGRFYFGICVDSDPNEINTNNNCASKRIEAKTKTDLSIKDFTTDKTSIEKGDEVIFSTIVGNDAITSDRATTNVILRYYSSNDGTIGNEDDLEIATSVIANLAADSTTSTSETITLSSGPYYGVCVESGDDNPADNCSSAILIEVFALGSNWQQATAQAPWVARSSHASLVFANKMWVLGGYDGSNRNDVWYSTDGKNWTQAATAGWTARFGHTSLVYDNKMWVLGGYDGSEKNDVWYSTDGETWQLATDDATWHDRRNFTSLVYDNKMWVMGGTSPNQNDIWYSTDGVDWTLATNAAAWSGRHNHTSLVYDNKMWVLGGNSDVQKMMFGIAQMGQIGRG